MTEPELDVHSEPGALAEALRTDVRSGFSATQKWLPAKWFYDARGSELFEEITALPEYYPTRAERETLAREAAEIARVTGARTLVELGSGSSEKTRLLLDGLRAHGTLQTFVPLDVSASALADAVAAIRADYPGLEVRGVVGDFTEHLGLLPGEPPRIVAFLGGTIGNLLPADRLKFLRSVRDVLTEGEWLLLGTDLVKDPETLVRAYDDAAGVTAQFDLNMLRVVNELLGADFDLDRFTHESYWDAANEWIEMRLRAREDVTVRIPGAGMTVHFAEGEYIRTEISAKFRAAGVAAELAESGFAVQRWWTDAQNRFGVSLAEAVRDEMIE
ncbi:L-histidine N(alpha)-methyltransferase [Amycolatopsis acidiphila]|uniref:Histidine N-alpha-methyltransferase n=1 Tax=Amycolatopsis acidiphila TaxID=715473 RepID=A0A557ZRE5_9PSEU|nr:L-histidine N(alpha)-methyltransferase [Amycolatopsis acidiphila]TVT14596.1 L-histidine N(alpha)-methyltransferase [Amycolatopsis acidiphila]UIJ62836.1 L-histidine N(alpha)-methyltransferase [Amycolatopsis acidiphila]GHG64517.1 histidine N-alpha-methyltransferase [Amycolatopsis acidiphila]